MFRRIRLKKPTLELNIYEKKTLITIVDKETKMENIANIKVLLMPRPIVESKFDQIIT